MTAARLRIELDFSPGRSADRFRRALLEIVAWRRELAPRSLERSSDADAPAEPEIWTDARWDDVAMLAAGDAPRSWSLFASDAALVVARERASTRISIVLPRPADDPFTLLASLLGELGTRDVPALAMAFDPESRDERFILQGIERLDDVPPILFLEGRLLASVGGAERLLSAAPEARSVAGGVLVRAGQDRARETLRTLLALPRSFSGGEVDAPHEPELTQFWPTGAEGRFRGVWSASPDLAWAVGDAGLIARWVGDDWTLAEGAAAVRLGAVSGWKERAWAVGEHGQIFGWDGRSWAPQPTPVQRTLHGVHASAPDRAIAVGERGCILRWDGRAWSEMESGTERGLLAVSGASGREWAVGEAGTVLHCADGRWRAAGLPDALDLHAVSCARADEPWVAGASGRVLRRRDGRWHALESGTHAHLNGVLALGHDDVWVVGDQCTIRHWNGHDWHEIASDTREELQAVCTAAPGAVWTVGSESVILRARARRTE